ncbi:MAG: hypothetical protein JNN28_11255 [Saprospiraceae bacterium]|nr:hypothetical protein [Saprospiraceae bacterium]
MLILLGFGVIPLSAQNSKKKPVSLHGTVSLGLGAFNSQNYPGRQPSFFWTINGNPVLTAFGIPMPINAMVSNQTKSLQVPFSQLGISPNFKWLKLHLGTRNLSYSPFSIAGHSFLGAGVEMNPGAFRFAALGGRFQKAREADSTSAIILRPAYKRLGYGFKVGVGKKRNYFDLIFFKAKDDSSSVSQQAATYRNFTPDENLVLGVSSKISFGKRLSLKIDGGGSLYTRDIRTNLLTDEGENNFSDIPKAVNRFFPVRIGSSLSFAGEAGLRYQSRPFQLGLIYRRVEPEYRSMGAWFFQTDIQQITLNPGFSWNKGKVRLQCNAGWQSDDLLNLKPARSQRVIGGFSLSLNPSEKFGIDIQGNNFQFTQENRYLNSDSLRLQQATRFFNISPHWLLQSGDRSTNWSASVNYQQSDDYNPYTLQTLRSDFVFGQVLWSLQHQKKGYNLGLGVNGRLNKNNLAAEDQSFGLLANAGKLLKEKLQIQANLNWNVNLRDGASVGYTAGGGGGISYKALKTTRLYLNAYYLSNKVAEHKYHFVNTSGGIEYTF